MIAEKGDAGNVPLDLYSTSQQDLCFCSYHAPFFGYETAKMHWTVVQGNCHHWDCPKCGEGRARKEYGRIVSGCIELEKEQPLYFVTITCKGKGLTLDVAMKGYGQWTNHLLTLLRRDAKKRGINWSYVQVTEQQGRGHPHSHILTTWYPDDLIEGTKNGYRTNNAGEKTRGNIPCLRSPFLADSVVRAKLGEQYDISKVDKVAGAARYVAKYLFHPSMFSVSYPKNWKRIRYSQNFPSLPKREVVAMVLIKAEHWRELAQKALFVQCRDNEALGEAQWQLRNSDVILTRPEKE